MVGHEVLDLHFSPCSPPSSVLFTSPLPLWDSPGVLIIIFSVETQEHDSSCVFGTRISMVPVTCLMHFNWFELNLNSATLVSSSKNQAQSYHLTLHGVNENWPIKIPCENNVPFDPLINFDREKSVLLIEGHVWEIPSLPSFSHAHIKTSSIHNLWDTLPIFYTLFSH